MGKGKIIGSLTAGKDESGEGDEGRERDVYFHFNFFCIVDNVENKSARFKVTIKEFFETSRGH